MKTHQKASRRDVIAKLLEIINTNTEDPVESIVALGHALTNIGEALRGQSPQDARDIIEAAAILYGIRLSQ